MYSNETHVTKDYLVSMPDGVQLYTQVFLPAAEGSFPVIIFRNPYTESATAELGHATFEGFEKRNYLNAGYALIYQHCRGTGRSEGDFIPFVNEHDDGLAFMDWIRQQPFYNGSLYLIGGSYLSLVHLQILSDCADDVKGALLIVMHNDPYRFFYENGFLRLSLVRWFTDMYKKKSLAAYSAAHFSMPDSLKTRPFISYSSRVFGEDTGLFTEILSHPRADDPFWTSAHGFSTLTNAARNCRIPILFMAGWHDIFANGMCRMWDELPDAARSRSALVAGPWGHAVEVFPNCEYPLPDGNKPADAELMWFDHLTKGTDFSFIKPGHITQYEFNGQGWKTTASLEGSRQRIFYFGADQMLIEHAPASGSFTRRYDPENPASFPGSNHNLLDSVICRQPAPDFREDVVTFISEPVDEEWILQGGMEANLRVMSDCEDTAFYIRVSAVIGDDTWFLRDSITSIRYEHPDTPYIPGTPVDLSIRLTPISFRLKPGNRLRVDISFSNFPAFLPHTNTAGPWAEQTESVAANNTMFCEGSFLQIGEA